MKRFFEIIFIIFMAAFISGCSTLADAQLAKGSGSSRVYDKSYDVVWNAVIEVVHATGLPIVAENKDKGSILAQGAISAFSWGENVAIFVENVDGKIKTRVEVVNKRAVATNITAPDWERRILEGLDNRLNNNLPNEQNVSQSSASSSPSPSQSNQTTAQKLRDLQELRKDGVISEDEYQSKKKQLIEKM